MIHHIVLFRLKPDVTEAAKDAFVEQALQVLGPIPGVRNLRVGHGLGKRAEVSHPLALIMDFDDEASLAAYQVHPEHQRFVHEIAAPIEDDKKVYDYNV